MTTPINSSDFYFALFGLEQIDGDHESVVLLGPRWGIDALCRISGISLTPPSLTELEQAADRRGEFAGFIEQTDEPDQDLLAVSLSALGMPNVKTPRTNHGDTTMDAIADLPADLSLSTPGEYWIVQARWRYQNMRPGPNLDPIVSVTFPQKPRSDEARDQLYRRLADEGNHHALVYDLELYRLGLARDGFDDSTEEE
jgi:hypothetical protein